MPSVLLGNHVDWLLVPDRLRSWKKCSKTLSTPPGTFKHAIEVLMPPALRSYLLFVYHKGITSVREFDMGPYRAERT